MSGFPVEFVMTGIATCFLGLVCFRSTIKGERIFRDQGIVVLLLVSMICSVPGLALMRRSGFFGAPVFHPQLFLKGMFAIFGGMLIGPILFSILGNRILAAERKHSNALRARRPKSGRSIQQMVKNRERMLTLRNRPSFAIWFCFFGMMLGIAMMEAGRFHGSLIHSSFGPHALDSRGMAAFGGVISFAYFSALVWVVTMLLRKKWRPFLDAGIHVLDLQIKNAQDGGSTTHAATDCN